MSKPIPVETDESTEFSTSTVHPLGDMMIGTPRGVIHAIESPGWMTMHVTRMNGEKVMCLMLYNADFKPGGDDVGLGMITQFDAGAMRSLGVSLLRMADDIDPVTKQ